MAGSRTFKVVLLSVGRLLTSVVGLLCAMVLTRVLTVLDYATYGQTLLAYNFAVPFLSLGLPSALFYFLPGERRRPRAVLVENLLLLAAMGGLFSLFLLLGGGHLLAVRFRNPDLVGTLRILVPYPLFVLPALALSACLMARDRPRRMVAYNVSSRLLMFVLVAVPCLIWRTPEAALAGTVAGAGIMLVPALKLMFGACPGEEWRPTRAGMWAQLKYSVPLGLATMIETTMMGIDKIIVAAMCTTSAFAVFSVGAVQIPMIAVITGSLTSVLIPEFAGLYKEERYADMLALWQKAMVRSAVFILPIMFYLLAMAPEVMRVLFSAKYADSAAVFRVYLLLLPVRITSYGAVFMATGNTSRLVNRGIGGLVINAILSVLLVRWVGYLGASVGTVLTIYLWTVPYNLYHIARILRTSAFKTLAFGPVSRAALGALAASVVFLLPSRFRPESDLLDVVLTAALFFPLCGALLQAMGLLKLREMIHDLTRKKAPKAGGLSPENPASSG
ncbi:MAG: oligosaccharide flippase family protein [Kiritimatiellae bacterium]|nr:oligosaccharide flippase family protein [Kiritimatiellia bacterium]